MEQVPTEELQTYPCKIDGCENRATANRGVYAYLCDEHKAEKPATENGRPEGDVLEQVADLLGTERKRLQKRIDLIDAMLDAANGV